jgi:hypothetical protein
VPPAAEELRRRTSSLGIIGGVVTGGALVIAGLAGAVEAPAPTVDQTKLGTDKLPPTNLRGNGLKITKKEYRKQRVVFSVGVPGRVASETLAALGEYQLSFCTDDDISGGGAANSACIGISRYQYTPKIRTRLVLAPSPTDTSGTVLADWQTVECRNATHHCPVPFGTSFTGGAGGGYVNVVAAADSNGANVDGDDVLDVEKKGKLDVIRVGANRQPDQKTFRDGKLNAKKVPVVPNKPKSKVAFSVKVRDVKKDDVLQVHSSLTVSKPSNYAFNPLVTTRISAKGRSIVGVNGPNCTGTCEILDAGATRVSKPGTVRVRLFVRAGRNDPAATGGVVRLESGALTVIRHRAG